MNKSKLKVMIINGPNLNLIGTREPTIYGHKSFASYLEQLVALFPELEIEYYQSNVEGELINKIQEVGFSYDYIVINAGGYTHTSISISDAIAAISTPCIEVHISQPQSREDYRHKSFMAPVCMASISGFGLKSYRLALDWIKHDV